jgi:hypothetical protein
MMDMFDIIALQEDLRGQKRAEEVDAASGAEEFSDKAEVKNKGRRREKIVRRKRKRTCRRASQVGKAHALILWWISMKVKPRRKGNP